MRFILIVLFAITSLSINGQVHEDENWCRINCDPEIDRENTKLIYSQILNDSLIKELSDG